MAGIDILLRVAKPLEQLRAGIAEILGVPPDQVAVIEDINDYPSAGTCHAVCQVYRFPEGFEQMLTITWPTEPLRERMRELLARKLGVECLSPSDSSDPYQMELLQPDGTKEIVSIDAPGLDERGVYLIEK